MTRIAVLDDYQGVALDYADWGPVKAKAEVTVFTDHLADPAAVVERLRPFEIICAMRERTPLTSAIIGQLPALKPATRRSTWRRARTAASPSATPVIIRAAPWK
jgi:hypothetical protein